MSKVATLGVILTASPSIERGWAWGRSSAALVDALEFEGGRLD